MDGRPTTPDPVVIGQDEQSEIHVQPLLQSGRRHLDIRLWRRGPSGFAPSRSALTLEAPDLDALQEGITELLEASAGGQSASRVVWDNDEGRRLRAETEPFGTRYQARLGFWQRVRDTWKQADDGLSLPADQLQPLQVVLAAFRPWVVGAGTVVPDGLDTMLEESTVKRWPSAGGDWLTVEPGRIAFHPRGIRITAEVEETDGLHRLRFAQWRRQDSLWLPEGTSFAVSTLDLDSILSLLTGLIEADERGEVAEVELPCTDGQILRLGVQREGKGVFTLEERDPEGMASGLAFEPRLSIPTSFLSHLGRALVQGGTVLISQLSREERDELRRRAQDVDIPDDPDVSLLAQAVAEELPEETVPEPAQIVSELPNTSQDLPLPEPPELILEPEPVEPPIAPVPLGNIRLGSDQVELALQRGQQDMLVLSWAGESLHLPLDGLTGTLSELRGMYFEALLGRRGRTLQVGDPPRAVISVHNEGTQLYLALTATDGEHATRLSFPAAEVPVFLDAAAAAMDNI